MPLSYFDLHCLDDVYSEFDNAVKFSDLFAASLFL